MPDISPRLALELLLGNEFWDRTQLNNNLSKLEKAVGVTYCTSATHPVTENYPGRWIKETDTGIYLLRNEDNDGWDVVSMGGGATQGASEIENRPDPVLMGGPVGSRLTVPTHVSPSGGQTTHPSVLYIPEGWSGYRYWMAHTPYPGGNDDHEDPNIVATWDGWGWVVPVGLTNPIDDQAGSPGAYNSDVDLRMGPNNTMYLFWRTYDPSATGQEEKLYYSKSTDGRNWTPKVNFYTSDHTVLRLLSPSLLYENGVWTMWAVNIVPSPNTVVKLVSNGSTPESGWSAPTIIPMGAMQAGKEPWHLSIIKDENMYVGLLNDCTIDASGTNGDILFIMSNDGNNFVNGGRSVIPRSYPGEHDNLYRATLVPAWHNGSRGYTVWYSAYLAGSPNTWNIYKSAIVAGAGITKRHRAGSVSVGIVANGATTTIPVAFPVGTFSAAPAVTLTAGSTRLTTAVVNITANGFDAQFTNWSGASASANTAQWIAMEK